MNFVLKLMNKRKIYHTLLGICTILLIIPIFLSLGSYFRLRFYANHEIQKDWTLIHETCSIFDSTIRVKYEKGELQSPSLQFDFPYRTINLTIRSGEYNSNNYRIDIAKMHIISNHTAIGDTFISINSTDLPFSIEFQDDMDVKLFYSSDIECLILNSSEWVNITYNYSHYQFGLKYNNLTGKLSNLKTISYAFIIILPVISGISYYFLKKTLSDPFELNKIKNKHIKDTFAKIYQTGVLNSNQVDEFYHISKIIQKNYLFGLKELYPLFENHVNIIIGISRLSFPKFNGLSQKLDWLVKNKYIKENSYPTNDRNLFLHGQYDSIPEDSYERYFDEALREFLNFIQETKGIFEIQSNSRINSQ